MRKIVLAAVALIAAVMLKAAPAYPGLITITQSDGSEVSFYLHGDEYFSYMTSTDGYLLATGESGLLEYGQFLNGKYVVPTGVAAHNELNRSLTEQMYVRGLQKVETLAPRLDAAARQQRIKGESAAPIQRFPRQGSPRTVILLVNFSDRSFQRTKQDFVDMATLHNYSYNGATGSIKDYFEEVSFNQFSPQFDVYGPYTLPHTMQYYGEMVGANHDIRPYEMIIDACNAADPYVDFSLYDTDNNGSIDNVFVYYAGYNQAEGGEANTIWPHRSRITGGYSYDGKSLNDYACTSELKGASGATMCGIGTFCHEFSHVVGLPDFYDTDYSTGYSAMGSWDLMTSGNYNNSGKTPPTYTAYERFYLGWLTPTALAEDTAVHCEGSYQLQSLISSNTAYVISKTQHNLSGSGPNPAEFYMLEYRKREGRDTYSGLGEGMLITHVVYDASKWTSNGPNNDRTNLGYEPILPTQYSVCACDDDCYPGRSGVNYCQFTMRNATEPLKRELRNIEDHGTYCEFDYLRNITNLSVMVKDIDAYTDKSTAVEEFVVTGFDIEEYVDLSFKTERGFKMRKKGDSGQFQRTLTLTPNADNTINDTIEIQYTPQTVTYDAYQYNKFIAAGRSGMLNKLVDFRYRNRRPVYIVTPEANEAQNVKASSFTASWSYVNDTIASVQKGAKYYLDLYTVSDSKNTETESFEDFPEMSEGWAANFNTVSTTYKKDGTQSVMFTSAKDTLWTKEYLSDVSELSFWIQSITSEGLFKVEAQEYATGIWKTLKTVNVDTKTNGDYISSLPAGYRKFRISYAPAKGQVVLDCFSATTASTTTFICKNQLMTDTFYNATGLSVNTEYKYVVRATDKDAAGRYENISDYSNEVSVITQQGGDDPQKDPEATNIKIGVSSDGTRYVVEVSEVIEGYSLFVYSIDGKLVKKVDVASNAVILPELLDGVYVLKYTKDGKNNRKDGVTKMYYHLK